jgi:hypothetical protein
MILLALLLASAVLATLIMGTGAHQAVTWGPPLWGVWAVLAVGRVGATWLALLGSQSAGAGQVIAYSLVLLTLPESLLVRSLSGPAWAAALSVLVAAGSLAWAAIAVGLLEATRRIFG